MDLPFQLQRCVSQDMGAARKGIEYSHIGKQGWRSREMTMRLRCKIDRRSSLLCLIRGFPRARLQKAADKLTGSRKLLNQSFEQLDRKNVRQLSMKNREVQKGLINRATDGLQAQINRNKEEIERLQALIVPEGSEKDAAAVQNNVAGKAGLQPDLPSLPSPSPTTAGAGDEGPWTSISFLLSSSYSHTTDESSAWSLKAEATYRSWFNSVNMGLSHEQSHAAALREMANATIRVSFECMRVDITRPWLRPELFLDHDLRVADGDQYVWSVPVV